MATITFLTHDGQSHEVPLIEGVSLMEHATSHAVAGIDGDCGGECACGTCHVHIDEAWHHLTGAASEEESQMLEIAPEVDGCSRLACQVTACAAMDGMRVRLPEFQL